MAPDAPPQPSRPGGLSLYANLLNSSSTKDAPAGTISRAPVVFKQPAGGDAQQDRAAGEKQQQISAASLRFQPTKRPQLSAQKPKPKPSQQKSAASAVPSAAVSSSETPSVNARPPAKTTLADWTAEADENDVNGFYGGEKRQRGGRKKRKKNKEESQVLQNWDDIYDPSRPNNYEDYKHSDERIAEIREWKDRLYAHRMAKVRDDDSDSSEDRYRPQLNKQFAPPTGMSFAPPPTFDDSDKPQVKAEVPNVPNDPTGEDAYARRMRLSGLNNQVTTPEPPPFTEAPPLPSPPPPPPSIQAPPESVKPSAPTPNISRAPVRYNLPSAPSEIPSSEAELETALQDEAEDEAPSSDAAPRSLRPGQAGFAERLMSKYGWSKGSGLGASGSGIVNPLRVQVEKQKKKPDSEGGGFVGPSGRGKILGGKKKGGDGDGSQEGKFGTMSEVVVLHGMVDGMDLDAEMGQGGLMQEIGEECGEKYGRVERVFIDRSDASRAPVFVKFTSQLSALRAVNALEGRTFNGNTIVARFFDTEKFESGIYK
ncbi:hypothetical protein ACLMJK_007217 [Lecanora helva]